MAGGCVRKASKALVNVLAASWILIGELEWRSRVLYIVSAHFIHLASPVLPTNKTTHLLVCLLGQRLS